MNERAKAVVSGDSQSRLVRGLVRWLVERVIAPSQGSSALLEPGGARKLRDGETKLFIRPSLTRKS